MQMLWYKHIASCNIIYLLVTFNIASCNITLSIASCNIIYLLVTLNMLPATSLFLQHHMLACNFLILNIKAHFTVPLL